MTNTTSPSLPQSGVDMLEVQARTITAASDLASLWVSNTPGAADYLNTGWGLAVELKMMPSPPCLTVSFIDPSDSSRHPQLVRELK